MSDIYSLHLASASILIIISCLYIFLKKLPTILNCLYALLITDAFVLIATDTLSTAILTSNGGTETVLTYILDIISYSTLVIFLADAFYIVYFNLCARRGINRKILFVTAAPLPVFFGMIIFGGTSYNVLENGNTLATGLRPLTAQIAAFFYLLLTVILVLCKRKKSSRSMIIAFFAIASIEVSTTLLQIFTTVTNTVSFSVSLITLVFFFTIENPNMSLNANIQIFNRQGFIELVRHLFSMRKSFGVITIQFEDYRSICATFGVREADKYIASIAEKIQKIHLATVFLTKNSELTVIMKVDRSKIVEHAYNISFFLNQGCTISGAPAQSRYHVCVFECPENAVNVDAVFDTIEYMLSLARSAQRSNVLIYDSRLIEEQKRYEQIHNLLTHAINENGLMVYYQPVYDAKTKQVISAEALVRLKSTALGYISPEEFIPIAEKSGLISKLGMIVFESVCSFIRQHNLDKTTLKFVEVNLSGVQCKQLDLPEKLLSVMKRYDISPSFINLEITETVAMQSSETLLLNMNRLIKEGVTFSLDDYGSGYSNVLYITDFPFSIIKLDKNLIWSYFDSKNTKSKTVLEANVEMLKKLDMSIIAEGVETSEQAETLAKMGVNSLQGFYFSKPVEEGLFLTAVDAKNNTAHV